MQRQFFKILRSKIFIFVFVFIMFTISIINFSLIVDLILQIFNFLDSINLWFILSYEIIILSLILLLASRSTDKILKGLQGTASATVITRGAIDAYEAWKNSNPSDDDNSKDNKDNKDNKEDKKGEVENEDKINEEKDNNKTNEK